MSASTSAGSGTGTDAVLGIGIAGNTGLRVLLVSDFYPPQVGGMEQHVQALARQLRRLGHEVLVVTTGARDQDDVLDGVAIRRVRGSAQRLTFAFASDERRYPPPLIDPELTRAIGRRIDQFQPDVIHAHGWITYSALAANLRRRRPLVVTLHDYGYFCVKRTLLRDEHECVDGRGLHCLSCAAGEYGWAKSIACYSGTEIGLRQLRGVDAFIAVSDYVRQQSRPYLGDRPIAVLPNFIDPAELAAERPAAAELATDLPARFLVFVGVLAPFKGVDDAIAAFRLLKTRSEQYRELQLLLLGPEHPAHHYADDPALGIRVLRHPARSLVVEALARSACVLIPSRCAETASRVAIEAVCAGRPVVAAEKGGIPEMLAGAPNTLVVPPNAPAPMADAIETVLGQTSTEAPSERWGGPPDYLPLQPARVAGLVVELYSRAMRARSRQVVELVEQNA